MLHSDHVRSRLAPLLQNLRSNTGFCRRDASREGCLGVYQQKNDPS